MKLLSVELHLKTVLLMLMMTGDLQFSLKQSPKPISLTVLLQSVPILVMVVC